MTRAQRCLLGAVEGGLAIVVYLFSARLIISEASYATLARR